MCLMTLVPVEVKVKKKINSFGAEVSCRTTSGAGLLPVLKELCKLVWHDECQVLNLYPHDFQQYFSPTVVCGPTGQQEY